MHVSGKRPGTDSITLTVGVRNTNLMYYKTVTAAFRAFTLPADLTKIEANAFEGIDAESVFIPDGCTEIGAEAFKNCLRLKYVSYKQGTEVASDAFVRTMTGEQYPKIQYNIR